MKTFCNYCKLFLEGQQTLREHMKRTHGHSKLEVKSAKNTEMAAKKRFKYHCLDCSYSCVTRVELAKHSGQVHGRRTSIVADTTNPLLNEVEITDDDDTGRHAKSDVSAALAESSHVPLRVDLDKDDIHCQGHWDPHSWPTLEEVERTTSGFFSDSYSPDGEDLLARKEFESLGELILESDRICTSEILFGNMPF